MEAATRTLRRYYAGWSGDAYSYTGSQFDSWPRNEVDRFTADDLVAVTFLSVDVPARAAHELLHGRADHFNALLGQVSAEADLAAAETIEPGWWDLMAALKDLPGVGPTTASKLYARKRPRLRPIYDSVVETYLGPDKQQREPLRHHLSEERPTLSADLAEVIAATDDIPDISPLRALDVICWMCARPDRS